MTYIPHYAQSLIELVEATALDDSEAAKTDARRSALDALAQTWDQAVAWFALRGPLNGHERVPISTILAAEEANPFDA